MLLAIENPRPWNHYYAGVAKTAGVREEYTRFEVHGYNATGEYLCIGYVWALGRVDALHKASRRNPLAKAVQFSVTQIRKPGDW